jgi:hypothetical protein
VKAYRSRSGNNSTIHIIGIQPRRNGSPTIRRDRFARHAQVPVIEKADELRVADLPDRRFAEAMPVSPTTLEGSAVIRTANRCPLSRA